MSALSLIPEERRKCTQSLGDACLGDSVKFSCTLNKRRLVHPLLSSTAMLASNDLYRNGSGDKSIVKRVLSAKEHRLKTLQNKLSDAHFHLSELSNENRLLRNIQKRQESALQRYESSNGDIPKMMNSYAEEVRSWQVRHKQLKAHLKETAHKLKEKELEHQLLSDEHKHLKTLSKDTSLGEREKLQHQVAELTDKIKSQSETISTLQRRITLEAKNFRHQLHVEMSKHRETQQRLEEAVHNSDRLTAMLESKDKTIATNSSRRFLPKVCSAKHNKGLFNSLNLDGDSKHIGLARKSGMNLSLRELSIPDSQNSNESIPKTTISTKSSSDEKSIQNNAYVAALYKGKSNYQSFIRKQRENMKGDVDSSGDTNTYCENETPDLGKNAVNGAGSLKAFESDTDVPKSSDEDVKERIAVMKKKLSQQMNKDLASEPGNVGRESEVSRQKSTSEDSSPEEYLKLKEYKPSKKNQKRRSLKSNKLTDLNECQSDATSNNVQNSKEEFDVDKISKLVDLEQSSLDKSRQEIERVTRLDKDEVEKVLDNFCSDVIKKVESADDWNVTNSKPFTKFDLQNIDISLGNSNLISKPGIFSKNVSGNSSFEMNNNVKDSLPKKKTPELNDDEKKKLLATLKAIDTGEDDGLHFDKLKKSRTKNTNLVNNNNNKRVFK